MPPARRRPIDLDALLAAMPLLLAVPLLALAALLFQRVWDAQQRQSREEIERAVDVLARAVELRIDDTARRLELLGRHVVPQVADAADAFRAAAAHVLAHTPEWLDLSLADEQGRHLASVRGGVADGPQRADTRQVPAVGLARVSSLDRPGADAEPTVAVSVPLRADGGPGRVLSAHVRVSHFAELLGERGPGGVASIVDREFRLLARSTGGAAMVGRTASPGFVEAARRSEQGSGRGATLTGTDSIVAWQRLRDGWWIAMSTPVAALQAPIRTSLLQLAAGGAAMLALAVLAGLAVGRHVGRAVRVAGEDARALAGRDAVPPRRRSGIAQVDALSSALHETGHRLVGLLHRERHARASAEAASRGKDEFLAVLGHELRNPMSTVVNATRLLRRDDLPPPHHDAAIALLERQAAHMNRLVDDLLDVGRILAGRMEVRDEPVDLGAVAAQAIDALRAARGLERHRLAFRAMPSPVRGDPVRLTQVVANLLSNAVRYTPPDGHVEVTVDVEGAEAVLRVRDDGAGMSPELLSRAFELFERGDPDPIVGDTGGLGVGLALCRMLVERHGGRIEAASDGPGRGSTFEVRLPAVEARTAADRDPVPAVGAADPVDR
jgi:signal transduction histidine kinase